MKEEPFAPFADLSDNVHSRFFIDGRWQTPSGAERFELIYPANEEVTLSVPAGSQRDMEAAIAAALPTC